MRKVGVGQVCSKRVRETKKKMGSEVGDSILCNDRFVYSDNKEGSFDGDQKQSRWHEAESTTQITAFPTASESLFYGNSVRCMHLVSRGYYSEQMFQNVSAR